MNNIIDAKERILKSAADLFAQYGFAGVGVRDIAKEAGVNLSMISYYFNGKLGILKAIVEDYFREMEKIVTEIKNLNLETEEHLKLLIKKIVIMIRQKTNLCKSAIIEMPIEIKEFRDFKNELMDKYLNLVKSSFPIASHYFDDKKMNSIIGPAFISLVFSHFLMSEHIKGYYNIELNEDYYNQYSEVISTLFLNGVRGLRKEIKNNK